MNGTTKPKLLTTFDTYRPLPLTVAQNCPFGTTRTVRPKNAHLYAHAALVDPADAVEASAIVAVALTATIKRRTISRRPPIAPSRMIDIGSPLAVVTHRPYRASRGAKDDILSGDRDDI